MNTRPLIRLLSVVVLPLVLSYGASAADPVAKVNGSAIPQSRLDAMLKGATAQGQPESPELRNRVRDELITREILMQEAAKKGTEKTADVVNQLEFQRQSLIIQAFLNDYVRSNPVSDEALRKEYDSAKAAAGAKEYRARHILVDKEADATAIIASLKKGAKFEEIAKKRSKDTGSGSKGGDLDWASPARYVKPFSDALVKLKKGQSTDTPVQSPFGWHIIRLDDERATKLPPFEDVKSNIQQQLQQQVVQKLIADLRSKAKIE